MILDLQSETWSLKSIENSGFEIEPYAVAVTLPNGDCLITGGNGGRVKLSTVY